MNVIKRDGSITAFNREKIKNAVLKAFKEVDGYISPYAKRKAHTIAKFVESHEIDMSVEEIQDIVIKKLMASDRKDVAIAYTEYRYKRKLVRETNTTDKSIMELLSGTNEYWNTENANKNARNVTVQRDYIAGITSTDITRRFLLPKDIVNAHDAGYIHFHDADYFAQYAISNCCLCNLEDMLQNGTVINGIMIRKPHRFLTAMTIATQIITAVTSSQYGGCSITLTHLAPFVRESEIRIREEVIKEFETLRESMPELTNLKPSCEMISDKLMKIKEKYYKDKEDLLKYFNFTDIEKIVHDRLMKEINDGVQTFNYQCNSMSTTNGQAPFLSVFMYLNETDEYKDELAMIIKEFLDQRILGMQNTEGVYITQAFPKLLYVLEPDNITPDGKYYYLTKLAAKCTAKRMVPDYISEKIMLETKIDANGEGHCYACMGCRSFLTPYVDENGKPKYWGRFNQGVVTVSLPDIALSSGGDMKKFWKIFEERTELCHRALQYRHKRLEGVPSDVAPILWQHGAFARLEKGEKIDKLLHNGYSTISLGYAGLYECVKYMTGMSHTEGGYGEEFGIEVMEALNAKCKQWKEAENIDYSLYGTPIESTTYKFAKSLKKRFGDDVFVKLDGVDRLYITNSYHCPVFQEIDPFDKLKIESKFQKLSPGGAISYIESCDMTKNIDAVIQVIQYIYENIMYAEINTKSDYCQVCGYDGEIKIIDENNEFVWECPNCGNRDQTKMNVARRTCGYIGVNFFNKGRTNEILDRFVHFTDMEYEG